MNRILVIDDEAALREMVQVALAQKGYAVLEAPDGVSGLEAARKTRPDLILCDVNMEQVDGYDMLASLRESPATASIPVILMTGLANHDGMRHGMELGADDYLPKPFTIDGLYAAVEARLRKSQAVRQDAERTLADLRDNISLMLPHELRTPLNGILAYGELLSNEAAGLAAAEVAEMGQAICDSGKRLQRLIENFLIFTQTELLQVDTWKLKALSGRVAAPAQLIGGRARLQAQAAGRSEDLVLALEDWPLGISEPYLAKIVDELVQNAFKFSGAKTPVRVSYAGTKGMATLMISDRGRGFSAEQIGRIGAFMQFDRKLHEQQGLGLGLTIARRLAEVHGGSLSVSSEPGVGTTVTVQLPEAAPAA